MTSLHNLSFDGQIVWKIAIVLGAFVLLTLTFLVLKRVVLRWMRRLTGSEHELMCAVLRALEPALTPRSGRRLRAGAELRADSIAMAYGAVSAAVTAGAILALVASQAMRTARRDGERFKPSIYFQTVSATAFGVAVLLGVAESSDIEPVRSEFVKRITESYRQQNIKLA